MYGRNRQRLSVRLAVVTKHVEAGDGDERRRRVGVIRGAERRDARVGQVDAAVPRVAAKERLAIPPRQDESAVELRVRRAHRSGVSRGIDQHLRGRRSFVALEQRHDGAEIAPGAVAANRDAIRIGSEIRGVGQRPAVRGERVVERRRERMLGRESVADAEHVGPGLAAQGELMAMRHARGIDRLRPGLTGLAQVNSFTGMTDQQKVDWEAQYAGRVTFLTDLGVVLRTFGYLMRPPPVY